jgi:hypothetical protein
VTDVTNQQLVSSLPADNLVLVQAPKTVMTRTEAVVHAVWLVAVAGATLEDFEDVLREVQNT